MSARAEPGPRVYGHRGASAVAPANSLEAFREARRAGADGVELDVRLTRDRQVVVFHDRKVTLPSGRRVAIARLTLAELRQVDLGGGQRIPTLEEALDAIGPRMRVNIEIKAESPRTRGLEREVVSIVRRRGAGSQVLFSSFNPLSIRRVARLAPAIERAILVRPGVIGHLAPRMVRAHAIHPDQRMVTAERLAAWRGRGFGEVNTWTVNGPRAVRRMARLGVDGIITDDPARTRQALRGLFAAPRRGRVGSAPARSGAAGPRRAPASKAAARGRPARLRR